MMTDRGRGQNQDWDVEYDNSNYEPQNPDDSSSGYVNLDHCRLYITNIPRGLSDDGLAAAFSKYGSLVECYVSADPSKRYGLVSYETPGEAKAAMMKLNRTEPLNLFVNIAHKSKAKKTDNSGYRGGNSSGARYRDDRGFRDNGSTGSRSNNNRRQDFMANGDSMDDLVGDHGVLNSSLEPDINLELEQLKLQHLKLQEEQLLCKQRMLLLKQTERKPSSSTRCIMPDGRIVVRSVDQGDNDADNYGAGGGDASCAVCVGCGERAESFCSGCRVTPYCSAACQRRDWFPRHKKVCHNLKRQSGEAIPSRPEPEPESTIPAPAPLRRPRSPDSGMRDGSERMPPRRFGPPGSATVPTPVAAAARGGNRSAQGGQQSDNRGRLNRSFEAGGNDGSNARSNDRNDRDKNDRDRNNDRNRNDRDRNDRNRSNGDRNQDNRNSGYGRPRNQDGGNRPSRPSGGADNRAPEQDEDWGPAPTKPQEPKPQATPPAQKPAASPKPVEAEPVPSTSEPVPSKSTPVPTASARPIATIADCAPKPVGRLTPSNCVAELLSAEEQFLLSVDATGESCRGGPGWVCTTVIPAGPHADNYVLLIDPLTDACEAAEATQPRPGDLFAYRDPSEGAWYRARCLGAGQAALLDASRLVQFAAKDRCARLPKQFADIPEYCCLLESNKVKLTDTLECTVVSKSAGKLTVTLATESGPVGTATVRRWLPEVDAPPAAAAAPAASATPAASETPAVSATPAAPAVSVAPAATASAKAPAEQPQVRRPPVTNNSVVMLVDATEPTRVFVKPASTDQLKEFDGVTCDIAMYAADPNVPRLKELPAQGQTVIAKFTDGCHYRAFVKRVSSKLKRCLLEYIEYGNVEIEENLENMCACPPEFELSARPTLSSMVTLQIKPKAFSDPAKAYLDTLKDEHEMKLTIPSGANSGPTGTPIRLTVVKSGEDVNRKVQTLSTPAWQQHLERGGDVLEIESVHFSDIEYVDPTSGELAVMDTSLLRSGCVFAHSRKAEHAQRAFALAPMLEEYCNSALAKDPYLPKQEELCIAKCPKRNQWLRAVLLEQAAPGAPTAELQFFDYGDMAVLPVTTLRKMMPEFVRGIPAAVCSIEIKDFPADPTPEQLERAKRHMQLKADGTGALVVTRCSREQLGEYVAEAPDLIRAML